MYKRFWVTPRFQVGFYLIFVILLLSFFSGQIVLKMTALAYESGPSNPTSTENPGQFPVRPPAECDIDVELLIDISGSMARNAPDGRQNLAWAKEAAQNFIQEMGYIDGLENNEVRVGLSTFGMTYTGMFNSGVIRQPLTNEWWMVRSAVNNLSSTTTNGFGTCIECGLRAARADLFNNIEDPNRPKAIILISDGYGNRTLASGNVRTSLTTARAAAISEAYTGKASPNRVIYFVVGYGSASTFDESTLTGVANDPDSSYYSYKPDVNEWTDHFRDLALKVCERPVTNSCSVTSTHSTSSTSRLMLLPGSSTQIGTNFTNFSPLGTAAEVRYRLTNGGVVDYTPTGNFTVPVPSGSTALSYYFSRVNVTPQATAVAGSETELIADVYIAGAWACSATTHLKIEQSFVPAWWQIYGGDVVAARSNVSSTVPTSLPAKSLFASSFLGMPVFEGNVSPADRGFVGTPGWTVNTRFVSYITPAGTNYSYNYFASKFTPGANILQASIPNSTYFDTNPGTIKNGYQVYIRNGDLEVGSLNFVNGISKKVVVLVTGEVKINGKIRLDNGRDYFMVIARGDIKVANEVGDTTYVNANVINSEDVEGIFVTDKAFVTNYNGTLARQLVVRGMVIGWGNSGFNNGVDFQRNLNSGNTNYAAEIFEFAPDLLLNYPPFYAEKTITWREVAP